MLYFQENAGFAIHWPYSWWLTSSCHFLAIPSLTKVSSTTLTNVLWWVQSEAATHAIVNVRLSKITFLSGLMAPRVTKGLHAMSSHLIYWLNQAGLIQQVWIFQKVCWCKCAEVVLQWKQDLCHFQGKAKPVTMHGRWPEPSKRPQVLTMLPWYIPSSICDYLSSRHCCDHDLFPRGICQLMWHLRCCHCHRLCNDCIISEIGVIYFW